jgi:hypothetical protein
MAAAQYSIIAQVQGPSYNTQGQVVQGWTLTWQDTLNPQNVGKIFFPGQPTPEQVNEQVTAEIARTRQIGSLTGA